jgi:hypothetical protein
VVTLISLPREPRHPILVLVLVFDWRAQAPLPARVVLDADNNPLLAALGLPCTISCTAYKWSPLRLFLWYKLQGTGLIVDIPSHRRGFYGD